MAKYHMEGGPLDGRVFELPDELTIGFVDHYQRLNREQQRHHRYSSIDFWVEGEGEDHIHMMHEDMGVEPSGFAKAMEMFDKA